MKIFWRSLSILCVGLSIFGFEVNKDAANIFAYVAIVFAIFALGEK